MTTTSRLSSVEEVKAMDAKTLEALRGSIAKWEAIVDGSDADRGVSNCPLCQLFVIEKESCDGCPVSERTGANYCARSPYDDWHHVNPWPLDAEGASISARFARTKEHEAAATAELDFLKSLLPPLSDEQENGRG